MFERSRELNFLRFHSWNDVTFATLVHPWPLLDEWDAHGNIFICQVKLLAKHCVASMKISAMVFGPQIHWDLAQFGSTWCTLTLQIELVKLANVLLELSEVYLALMSLVQKDHPNCDEEQWLFELLTSHRSAARLQSDCSVICGAKRTEHLWWKWLSIKLDFFQFGMNISIPIQGRSSPVSLDKVNRWKLLELF